MVLIDKKFNITFAPVSLQQHLFKTLLYQRPLSISYPPATPCANQ